MKIRTSLALDENLIKILDLEAKKLGLSRSAYVQMLLSSRNGCPLIHRGDDHQCPCNEPTTPKSRPD
ncbi:ribbon-helix-helix domain-containing protein [Marichromatium gracile]|uniref:ribbon-helix-helix domain-containing protein n=1 Tax=Marichromatium gracile TaxID=1048 RepID=UPI00398C37FB